MVQRFGIPALLALVLSNAPAHSQTPAETPEQVAAHFVDAMRRSDWTGMARLMHPSALHQLHELLVPLLEAPGADDIRQQVLGVRSTRDAAALSDTAVFASLMQAVTRQPGLGELLQTAQLQYLGHVNEGPDTVHVVYRMTMTVQGVSITRMDVMSLTQSPLGWRGLLKGDLSAMAAAIRRAIEHRT